jgi:hypothetical protein
VKPPLNIDILKNELINKFQNLGSKNILVKDDQFTLKSGDVGLRFYGSLDIEKNNDLIRSNFTSVILPYEKKTIKLIIVYKDKDRYANKIESKILESFNIIKGIIMLKNIYFADPEFLIILIIIPFAVFFWFRFGKLTQATLRHPTLSLLKLNNSLLSKLRPF